MTTEPRDQAASASPKPHKAPGAFDWLLVATGLTAVAMIALGEPFSFLNGRSPYDQHWNHTPIPLVMTGGDPYIRALMRTISASESNDARPYSILYGGDYVQDLSHHPDRCVAIQTGPNVGDCTTAAGRYQFITSTWLEKAARYHPKPDRLLFWQSYSFEPEFQDQVVYAWLTDSQAWGVDIAELLRNGQVVDVLEMMSPIWTSLSQEGLEPNVMTDDLPMLYQQMLDEELAAAGLL
jgi:muramidase (phage lysozyme)